MDGLFCDPLIEWSYSERLGETNGIFDNNDFLEENGERKAKVLPPEFIQ